MVVIATWWHKKREDVSDTKTGRKRRALKKLSLKKHPWLRRVAILACALLIFLAGIGVGNGRLSWRRHTAVSQNLPAKLDYSSVDQLYSTLKANFDGKLDEQALLNGMKSGLVKAAGDPYTEFLDAKAYQDFNDQLTGSFTGIGAELGQDSNNNIIVIAPIAGFPAEKAGIKPKDIIAQIDGNSTAGMSVSEAVGKIRGPKNTQVKLTIVRDGTPQDITITRDDITVPSVKSEVKDGIGYLTISRFGDDTADLSQKAAEDFKSQNVKGVVVDLRSDPGGLLDAAVAVSSLWLPNGKTVLTERTNGVITQTYSSRASGTPILQGIPTAVLIDSGSASASEITAAALKDNGVATLVGEKSFGKGSVQQLIKLNGGNVLKVTIAHWYTPGGININKNGIKPDKAVSISADDVKAGRDPQKDAAVQALGL